MACASPCSWLVSLVPAWSSSLYLFICLPQSACPPALWLGRSAPVQLPNPISARCQSHLLKISSRESLEGTVIWCEQLAPDFWVIPFVLRTHVDDPEPVFSSIAVKHLLFLHRTSGGLFQFCISVCFLYFYLGIASSSLSSLCLIHVKFTFLIIKTI